MRFLVVDDSAVDRRLLVSLLTELGHEVEESDSTTGILDRIATGNYNSVFLDIVMPAQDGYKFLRELRANPATAGQHVIFCSSKKTSLEIDYGLKRAGANDYVVKPATRDSIVGVLQKVAPS
ncbi:MAG: response regulator [Cyanosarcina radialis HA8281-LM2]|jgi:two-component system chemotaxis response regulator CheY|nr:response regulator [Cyanosarcina radialis HA8281-LM2]